MSAFIYVLACQGGNFYVGKTTNVAARWKEHMAGTGAAWTRLHEPLRIYAVYACKSDQDESNVTEDLMKTHGIDHVRGGEYTQMELPDYQHKSLEVKFKHLGGACFICSSKHHFASQCPQAAGAAKQKQKDERAPPPPPACFIPSTKSNFAKYTSRDSDSDSGSDSDSEVEANTACYRCGRESHWSNRCYASRHINGTLLA